MIDRPKRFALLGGGNIAAESNDLLTDLVCYYALGEASGTRLDSHTNGYDLDLALNAPANIAAKNGDGCDFERSNPNALGCSDSALFSEISGLSAITVSMWLQSESQATCWALTAEQSGHVGWSTGGGLVFRPTTAAGGATWGYPTLTNATPTMVTCVFDGSISPAADRAEIYVDGSLVATTPSGNEPTVTGTCTAFTIGANNIAGAAAWDGWIDELAYWKRALSADDISTLWNDGDGLFYDGFD